MNILVNGGTRGMGRATVEILSKNPKNRLIVTGRNENALKSLVKSPQNKNIVTFVSESPLTNKRLESIKNHLTGENIKIDILINFAGVLHNSLFLDSEEEKAREMIEANFMGPALLIRQLIAFFSRGSHIVNIGSMGGFQGSVKFPGLSWYSASKAALASLTESLAAEFAEMGISVNCICPGAVQTEMLEEAFPGYLAQVSAHEAGLFIADFALNGHRYFNGKVLPFSRSTP
jgi:short-subunit dehydrogenase